MTELKQANHSRWTSAPLAGFAAILLVCLMTVEASGTAPVEVGRAVLKKVPSLKPHTIPRPNVPTLSSVTRRSLASGDNAQSNINALLQSAVQEGRIGDIEKLVLQQRYSAIPGRGDFALLECLKFQACNLGEFPDLATAVGHNQLHLFLAARCAQCNKINIYKLSGNTVEELMHSFYRRGGWIKLEGEIGNSGIDGLYYKTGPSGRVADVLVTEAKFNESILQETKSGTQLCKHWILDNLARLRDRAYLEKHDALGERYTEITDFVNRDVYRAQLWRMNLDDDRLFIWREHVSSKGRTIVRWPIHGNPPWNPDTKHVIDLLEPGSNFDRQIIDDYQAIVARAAINPAK